MDGRGIVIFAYRENNLGSIISIYEASATVKINYAQLMEYASGGRCRFDFKACGNFHTTWKLALNLFDEYKRKGDFERVRDIAPVVSMISGAIVYSLDTCGDLPKANANLFRNANYLLDLSNSLADKGAAYPLGPARPFGLACQEAYTFTNV